MNNNVSENLTLENLLLDYATLPEYLIGDIQPGVNTKSSFSDYPIHIAAVRGNLEEAKILTDNGADVNALGEYGYTPLHYAILHEHYEMVKFLLYKGANINIKDVEGHSCIDLASTLDDKKIYNLLLNFEQ